MIVNGVRVRDRSKKVESRVKKNKYYKVGNNKLASWYDGVCRKYRKQFEETS